MPTLIYSVANLINRYHLMLSWYFYHSYFLSWSCALMWGFTKCFTKNWYEIFFIYHLIGLKLIFKDICSNFLEDLLLFGINGGQRFGWLSAESTIFLGEFCLVRSASNLFSKLYWWNCWFQLMVHYSMTLKIFS